MVAVSSMAQFVTSTTILVRILELGFHMVAEAVARIGRHPELLEALPADIRQLIDVDREAHDPVARKLVELAWWIDAEHQRHVGDLEPASC